MLCQFNNEENGAVLTANRFVLYKYMLLRHAREYDSKILTSVCAKRILNIDKYLYNRHHSIRAVEQLETDYKKYAQIFKAAADETRLKIIGMLGHGELCACRILDHFEITQPTLSYHMKILCDSGLVSGRRDGAWMRYSLNAECLRSAAGMLDGLTRGEQRDEACDCQ